jgi:hypothetical protein
LSTMRFIPVDHHRPCCASHASRCCD